MARLSGITVVVTGAERPVGQAIVRRIVAEGAQVVATVAPGGVADDPVAAARIVEVDVTTRSSWDAMLASVADHEGDLHGLVNAAAAVNHGPLQAMSEDELSTMLSVNLLGPTIGIAASAPALAAAGGGSVINVASTDAQRGTPNAAAVAAASWGLRGLTRSAALELGAQGIRVNTVCAPLHLFDAQAATDASPAKLADSGAERSVTIGDAASMVVFLLSDDSATCTGGDYLVDGGASA